MRGGASPSGAARRSSAAGRGLVASLNRLLAPLEARWRARRPSVEVPQIFIVGLPRSGTTLTAQLLAFWGGFGYVSNFVARFWMAPSFGFLLEKALRVASLGTTQRYSSSFGRTPGWLGPHEFGFFWNRWFDVGAETHRLSGSELRRVRVDEMRSAVAGLGSSRRKPMVFSNNTWHTFHVSWLSRIFPRSLFVVCQRDPLFVAQSLLVARRALLGDQEAWWSVKPPQYPRLVNLRWWDQIAGQVCDSHETLELSLEEVDPDRIVRVEYRELCAAPSSVVAGIARRARGLGAKVPLSGSAPGSFETTDRRRVSSEDFERLALALRRYAGAPEDRPDTRAVAEG